MTNEEKYVQFLEERMKAATSIRSYSAYSLALSQFKKIYNIPEIPMLPSAEAEEEIPSETN